jgi:hypothetical protein
MQYFLYHILRIQHTLDFILLFKEARGETVPREIKSTFKNFDLDLQNENRSPM